MAALIYLGTQPEGQAAARRFNLAPGLNSIGRALDNNVVIPLAQISRHHAELALLRERAYLKDLGSSNQSFINGEPVTLAELKHGDEVRLGTARFGFSTITPTVAPAQGVIAPVSEPASALVSAPGSASATAHQAARRRLLADALAKPTSDDADDRSVIRLPPTSTSAPAQTAAKLRILIEIGRRLATPEDLDGLLERALQLLFEYLAVDRAAILLPGEDGTLVSWAERARPELDLEDGFYSRQIVDAALLKGGPIVTADATRDTRFASFASVAAQAIHATLCIPLAAREGSNGALYVDNLSLRHVYSDDDIDFVTAVAGQIAIAVENARLFERMQREARHRGRLERFFPDAVGQRLREEDTLAVVTTEVSALFCDLSGFTELCASTPPTQVIGMLNRYFHVMVEDIIFPHQGTLEKYIGDALLAFWGAPYARDDDPDRAVAAAAAMQRAIATFNSDWTAEGHAPLAIHIGIATGPVAAGNIGSARLLQYAAIGDTTNTASRICQVAADGEILLCQRTIERLTAGRFSYSPLPPVQVKGKPEPLALYRLDWHDEPPASGL